MNRDELAVKILLTLLASWSEDDTRRYDYQTPKERNKMLADLSYNMADAMIERSLT